MHLAAPGSSKMKSCRVPFRTAAARAFKMLLTLGSDERGCSFGAFMLKLSADELRSNDKRRDRMIGIIRARFNKRSRQAFPKPDHRSCIRNAPLPHSHVDAVLLRLPGTAA